MTTSETACSNFVVQIKHTEIIAVSAKFWNGVHNTYCHNRNVKPYTIAALTPNGTQTACTRQFISIEWFLKNPYNYTQTTNFYEIKVERVPQIYCYMGPQQRIFSPYSMRRRTWVISIYYYIYISLCIRVSHININLLHIAQTTM